MFHASEKTAPNSQGQSWKMGKEVGNLIYFQRILWEKTAFLIYLSDSRFFCLFSHLFLVNIASLFLFNAKISCQILWFAKGPHTHTKRSHIVSLPDWDQKKSLYLRQRLAGPSQSRTSCHILQHDRDYPVSTPWKHILWCSAYWVEDDIRSFPLPSVSITPISDPTCPSFIVNEAMFDEFLF